MIMGSAESAIWGLLGCFFWTISFLKYGKSAEIYLPKGLVEPPNKIKRYALFIIGLISWISLTIALIQPRLPKGLTKNKIKVNDIYFVFDVSRSMLAEDFEPNRLDAAKKKLLEFVDLRPTDRIGIVMFSERAFTLLPLSTDLKLVKRMVEEIRVGFLGAGTNIGDALALAVGRTTQSLAENKVIILLTDGVSNVGNITPLRAAEEAKKQKIKVYTIGIGKKSDKKVLRAGRGQYQRLPGGSVDLETLEKISKMTGGTSYFAGNANALKNVLGEIQKLEKTEIKSSSRVIYKELFYFYLLFGVLGLSLVEISQRWLLREGV